MFGNHENDSASLAIEVDGKSIYIDPVDGYAAYDLLPKETPGYGPKSEIAPGSLKIVCTPEATGDDNSRLEKFVEYTFQAIYIDWAPGPVAEFVYTITKGDLVKPGYVRTDPKNGVMKVTFTSPGIYKITLRCLNYPNNVRTRTFNVHEDVVPWNPVEVQM